MSGGWRRSWLVLAVVAALVGAAGGLAAWPIPGSGPGPACPVRRPVDVVLDPSHGGTDPGARYPAQGLVERDLTLQIARRVAALLETGGATVALTRDDNATTLGNSARGLIANACQARLFVSIHLNSVTSPEPNYALTLWAVAEKDLAFAQQMHAVLAAELRPGTNLGDGGIKAFDSGALLRARMPAVLVEPVFLSNREEAARLAAGDGARLAQVAAAIAAGVHAALGRPAPAAVGLAPTSAPLPSPPASPEPNGGEFALYDAVLPEHRADAVAATAGRLSHYRVAATLHSMAGQPTSITGTVDLRYHNDTGRAQSALYVRLYPNDERYAEGGLEVRDVTVDGVPVVPGAPLPTPPLAAPGVGAAPAAADPTLARLALPAPVPPGGTAAVAMAFTTTVPTAPAEGTGLFGRYPDTGTWVLAHWFPLLAGHDPSAGWDLVRPAPWDDPVFAGFALFDVTLTTPKAMVLAASGVRVEEAVGGDEVRRRYVSGPAREFSVVADDDFAAASRRVGGTTVTVYHDPEDAAGGEQILAYAAQAVTVFNEVFGPYPYAELDVVAVPSVVGFEFPQLVLIGTEFVADPAGAGSRVGAVEFLVAHEVAHQWWYGLVGNNQRRHAFLDEGLAEYAAVLYFERQHGAPSAEQQVNLGLRLRYASMVFAAGDHVVDQPTDAFPDETAYFTTVYRKAALGFAALRAEIGDAAFVAGLRAYVEEAQFGVAAPADLRAAFERAAGRDLAGFWRSWFEAAEGHVRIVVASGPATPAATSPASTPPAAPAP